MTDDLEDPALGSLRAVLHGMRDEEPSDRGLASLMAAARAQAGVMKPAPAWWERVLATLLRPPVLALASAAVLVGGGLVISRHTTQLDATSTAPAAAPRAEGTLGPGGGTAAAGAPSASASAAAGAPSATAGAPSATAGADAPAAPAGALAGRAQPPNSFGNASSSPAPMASATRSSAPAAAPARLVPPGPARPRPASPGTSLPSGGVGRGVAPIVRAQEPAILQRDEEAVPYEPELARQNAVHGGVAERVDDRLAGPGTDSAAAGAGAASARLHISAAQIQDWATHCEQAADRGDCVAVRALARQVEAAGPAVFRARLAANGDIARCLAP